MKILAPPLHARIYQSTRELSNLKQGDVFLGDYYAKINGPWKDLEFYQSIPISQENEVKNRPIY